MLLGPVRALIVVLAIAPAMAACGDDGDADGASTSSTSSATSTATSAVSSGSPAGNGGDGPGPSSGSAGGEPQGSGGAGGEPQGSGGAGGEPQGSGGAGGEPQGSGGAGGASTACLPGACDSGLCGQQGCRSNEIWAHDTPGRWVAPWRETFIEGEDPAMDAILYSADEASIARVDVDGVSWTVAASELCDDGDPCDVEILGIASRVEGVRAVLFAPSSTTIGGVSVTGPSLVAIELDDAGVLGAARAMPVDERPDRVFVEGGSNYLWIVAAGRVQIDVGGVLVGDGNTPGTAVVVLGTGLQTSEEAFVNASLGALSDLSRPIGGRAGQNMLFVFDATNPTTTFGASVVDVQQGRGFSLEVSSSLGLYSPQEVPGSFSSYGVAGSLTQGAVRVVAGGIDNERYLMSFDQSWDFPAWARRMPVEVEAVVGLEAPFGDVVVTGQRNVQWVLDGRAIPAGRFVVLLDPYAGGYRFHLPETAAVSIRAIGPAHLAIGEVDRVLLVEVPLP